MQMYQRAATHPIASPSNSPKVWPMVSPHVRTRVMKSLPPLNAPLQRINKSKLVTSKNQAEKGFAPRLIKLRPPISLDINKSR